MQTSLASATGVSPWVSTTYPSKNFLAFYHKSLIVLTDMSKNRPPQYPSHTLLSFMPFARYHSHGSIVLVKTEASLGAIFCIELPLQQPQAIHIPIDIVIAERETHGKRPDLNCG